jgi:hypothetical protein
MLRGARFWILKTAKFCPFQPQQTNMRRVRLVVGSVTTSESLMLYVFFFSFFPVPHTGGVASLHEPRMQLIAFPLRHLCLPQAIIHVLAPCLTHQRRDPQIRPALRITRRQQNGKQGYQPHVTSPRGRRTPDKRQVE